VFAGVIVMVGVTYLLVFGSQERRIRAQVLQDARTQEKEGNVDLAVRNLRLYTDSHPADLAPLEELARITATSARSTAEALEAASINDRLLRLDPKGANRQETRRRLVDLYVRCGDDHRASAVYRLTPEVASHELRYRVAKLIAQDMMSPEVLAGRPIEPRDHSLYAMALEGLAVPGDSAALAESVKEL